MRDKIQDLIAKYEFWYATKFIKLDKHYTFFLDLNAPSSSFAIKYLKKYDSVIVEFANIKIGENNLMNFDYDVIANPNNCNVKSKRFHRFTGHVMRSILHGAVENDQRENNENGNANLGKFGKERSVYAKGVAVPQKRVSKRKPRKKTVRRNKELHSEVQQSSTDSSVGDQS